MSPKLSTYMLDLVSSQGLQCYLGMIILSDAWELLKSHPNTPKSRLDIFAHIRRNTAPEQTHTQDQNFMFNPG